MTTWNWVRRGGPVARPTSSSRDVRRERRSTLTEAFSTVASFDRVRLAEERADLHGDARGLSRMKCVAVSRITVRWFSDVRSNRSRSAARKPPSFAPQTILLEPLHQFFLVVVKGSSAARRRRAAPPCSTRPASPGRARSRCYSDGTRVIAVFDSVRELLLATPVPRSARNVRNVG
jgi:hypothetical protein